MIPQDQCKPRHLYRLHSRNLTLGVFDGQGGFIGLRRKFESVYTFTEYHYDRGPPYGTVMPQEELEELPAGIELWERVPRSFCSEHGRSVYFKPDGEELTPGTWYHSDDHTALSSDDMPTSRMYRPLFDWLTAMREKYSEL